MIIDAILLAAGYGKRFSAQSDGALPKQFQMLGQAPVFIHSLRALCHMDCFRQMVVVVPERYCSLAKEHMDSYLEAERSKLIRVVVGGALRQDSSRQALEVIEDKPPTRVLIHDACRPHLSRDFLSRVKGSLLDRAYGAWIPVVPVVDTLKKVANSRVVETIDRAKVARVQTPQVFEYSVIRSLIDRAKDLSQTEFSDDASLCEYYGIPVGVFDGDPNNIKLTYSFEMEVLRSIVDAKEIECAPELGTISTV